MTQPSSFYQVLDRCYKATGWRKQKDLATFLGIKSPSISGAKERGSFPIDWAFRIAQAFNVSTDWLLTGKAPDDSSQPARCPFLADTPLSLTTQDHGNLRRFASELRNILDRQENQIAAAKQLLNKIMTIVEGSR